MKITKPKGVWKKRILISLMIVLGLALARISCWNISPVPKAFLIKKAFEGGTFVPSADYDHALNETKIVKDINYNSKFPDGKLDIIYPINRTEKPPIIFWMHGGGFVGRDKSDITGYAVNLAARGYIIVNIQR